MVAVAVVLGAAALIGILVVLFNPTGPSETAGNTADESADRGASDDQSLGAGDDSGASPSPGTGAGKAQRSRNTSNPIPSAESFEELPVDEEIVSRMIVEDTVCGLDGDSVRVLVGAEDGAEPDVDLLRDAVITLGDQIELWRQSEDLDPRINTAIKKADNALIHWRKAVGFSDKGLTSRVSSELAKAEAQLVAMDRSAATDLCPSANG